MTASAHTRRNLLLGVVLGLLALVAGVALAETFLPEWQAGAPPGPAPLRQRFRELAARGGFVLEAGEPHAILVTRGHGQFEPFRPLGDRGAGWLLATRTAIRATVSHDVRDPEGRPGKLAIDFSFDGQPQLLMAWPRKPAALLVPMDVRKAVHSAEILAPLLLAPGETLGPKRQATILTFPRLLYPIAGGQRPQHLVALMTQAAFVERRAGPLTEASSGEADAYVAHIALTFWRNIPVFLALGGLFLVLLLKARLSLLNGALLAVAALLTLYPTPGFFNSPLAYNLLFAAGVALKIFLIWSCGESLLRSTDPGFTTSLDALRAGRLGPRGGRALLVGFACGAGLAGLRLALLALAEVVPGAWPGWASIELPLLRPFGSPVADGILLAGGVTLAIALAVRLVPLRWAPATAAVLAGLYLRPVPVEPFLASVAVNTLFAGLLVWIGRRNGLTALLIAALCSLTLPSAILAADYWVWMPAGFALTAGLPAAFVLLGMVGMARSGAAEEKRLTPPAFVRRIEEERRFQHEMDLLAKMQRGLLPRTLPRLAGYELAARSIIANEAGGDLYDVLSDDQGYVWIAAGDVAGHGYSCAIALAMTKSALASLVGRGRTPAEVLHRVDRVLRAAGPTRAFTTLLLLRLNPATGEGLLSNAGHPYPLLLTGGGVEEIEISALPLGQGPPREYEDRRIVLPPGASFVVCSDGLFEAVDGDEVAYGFERLLATLRDADGRSAEKILETLLEDWRRHLRTAQPLDDTTLLVLRRASEREER
jgi:Stage II sporulation protein E (SpoIIE)